MEDMRGGQAPDHAVESLGDPLRSLAERMAELEQAREGSIAFRAAGAEEMAWTIECVGGEARVLKGQASSEPRAEVVCDPEVLRDVLAGRRDGRAALLEGGILVRGDIDFLQRLSSALGTHGGS